MTGHYAIIGLVIISGLIVALTAAIDWWKPILRREGAVARGPGQTPAANGHVQPETSSRAA